MRRKKVNPNDVGVRVDFTDDNGDNWMEYPIFHPQFKTWLYGNSYEFGSKEDFEKWLTEEIDKTELQLLFQKSPWYGSTANDIDWKKRVELQAVIQKYVTHSISSTINLPENVSKAEVSEIYLYAYDKGLKGVTVYRDGSRSGVLVNTETKKKDSFEYHDAPKRPTCLPVDVFTTVSKGTKWNVIVGLFDGKPYEVFAVPHFTNESHLELCKVAKGRYDLLKNKETYSEDITANMSDEEDVVTRLCSAGLRHGTSIAFIVDQLSKSNGDITSFSKAISRALKRYINANVPQTKSKCPECAGILIYEEGCKRCSNCSYSAC